MSTNYLDLPEDLRQFLEQEVLDGRFSSPAEVIKAGIALLEEREARLAALRTAIAESEQAAAVAFLTKAEPPPIRRR